MGPAESGPCPARPKAQIPPEEVLALFFPFPVCRVLGCAGRAGAAPNAPFPDIPLDLLLVPGVLSSWRGKSLWESPAGDECGVFGVFGVPGAGLGQRHQNPAGKGEGKGTLLQGGTPGLVSRESIQI